MIVAAAAAMAGCSHQDDNASPKYNKTSGAAVNCRAYVQVVIDGYRDKKYTADQSFDGLERNCGTLGSSWSK